MQDLNPGSLPISKDSVRTSHDLVIDRCFIRLILRNLSVPVNNRQILTYINTPGSIDPGVSCDTFRIMSAGCRGSRDVVDL